MFDLYEQGLGTHAIAKKTERSTHTVHSVLAFNINAFEQLPPPSDEPFLPV